MDITIVAVIAGTVLSILGALTASLLLTLKYRAEFRFRKKTTMPELRDDWSKTRWLAEAMLADSPEPENIRKALVTIQQVLDHLDDEDDIKRLMEGLRQPSERGRATYMAKLLNVLAESQAIDPPTAKPGPEP